MAFTVRASVVDLRTDTPTGNDKFIVDTNIWLYLFYPPASQDSNGVKLQQAIDYPDYIKKVLAAKATLYSTGLVFAEIAHNIERTQRKIYSSTLPAELETKKYRHDYPLQWGKVTTLIRGAWNDVLSISNLLEVKLDNNFLQNVDSLFPSVALDGYDAFTAEIAIESGNTQIITDDSDYATVPGLTIYTTNQKILTEAANRGKLIIRPKA